MKRFVSTVLALGLLVALVPATATAQPLDCAAYENYPGAEPAGYAEQCLGMQPRTVPTLVQRAPTDTAFAHDIGFVSDNVVSHALNDFPGQTVNGASTSAIFGYDYEETGTTLYGVSFDDNTLNTVDPMTGALTVVGPLTNLLAAHTVSGIGFAGDGTCYVNSTDGGVSALYTCDRSNGTLTLIGTNATTTLLIDIAVTCEGVIYGHDIGTDSIYTFDPTDASETLVGPTGVDSNFAQGMTYDRDEGTIYAYTYQGGGANQYGTIDAGSGALTPLAIDNPQGEFEGAAQTSCAQPPGVLEVPTVSTVGLVALALMLIAATAVMLRRRSEV